jgi:hypothetical protein
MNHNITDRTVRFLNRNKEKQIIAPRNNIYWKNMVSASSIRNYMLGDTLVDYIKELKLVTHELDEFTKHIMQAGNDFESELLSLLVSKGIKITKVANNHYDSKNYDKYLETINLMKHGENIIYQGVLINESNHTYGMPDIIIRSDYINKLFDYNVISDTEANLGSKKLGTNWHYKIIDIKHSTLHLDCTGVYIHNNGNIPAYKGQVLIYTEALNKIQGDFNKMGFIWAKKYEYTSDGTKKVITNFLTKLGTIDYNDRDLDYVDKTMGAIDWMLDVRKNASKWKLDTSSLSTMKKELFPNMNVISDSCYMKFKKEFAHKIGDITLLWNCGPKERVIAHSKGIYSIYDPKLSAETLELKNITGCIVDKMLSINRMKNNFLPEKFSAEKNYWQEINNENGSVDTMEFSIDFETFSANYDSTIKNGIVCEDNPSYVFLIGIYYVIQDTTNYVSFVLKNKTRESEVELFNEFYDYINSMLFLYKKKNAKFYHWTSAETTNYNYFKSKHTSHFFNDMNLSFYDLSRVFKTEPIVIKGAYNYSLKTVVRALHGMGYIKTSWDETNKCGDGLTAMFQANKLYDMMEPDNTIMDDIISYNKVDCSSVWELLEFLRNNSINN